jgi:hypothetical protein
MTMYLKVKNFVVNTESNFIYTLQMVFTLNNPHKLPKKGVKKNMKKIALTALIHTVEI